MLRTLQSARQAMHLEQTRVDTLANNLANADVVQVGVALRLPTEFEQRTQS